MVRHLRVYRPSARWKGPLVALAFVATLLPVASRASGIPVVDFINWIQNYLQQYQAAAEYSEDARRWYDSYQHMQQQLIKLQGITTSMGPMTEQLARRREDYGMVESCRGSKGGVTLSALRQMAAIDHASDIQRQQRQLCERIVLAENAKYNHTVDMLLRLRARAEEFRQIEQRRASVGQSQGELAANDNDVARLSAGMQMELDHWEATLAGYESYIGLLRSDQQRLALLALNGRSGGAWGTVTQGAVLKGALETADNRDR